MTLDNPLTVRTLYESLRWMMGTFKFLTIRRNLGMFPPFQWVRKKRTRSSARKGSTSPNRSTALARLPGPLSRRWTPGKRYGGPSHHLDGRPVPLSRRVHHGLQSARGRGRPVTEAPLASADTRCKYGTDPHTLALQALRNGRLRQGSNGLFPVPLARLRRSDKCVCVVGIHDACVLSDIRCFQKRPAAFVDGDCLEMTESIAHEIDRGAFHRQRLCAFVGEDDGDCVEQHGRRTRQLSVRRQHRAIGKLRTAHFGPDDLHGGTRIGRGIYHLLDDSAVGTIRDQDADRAPHERAFHLADNLQCVRRLHLLHCPCCVKSFKKLIYVCTNRMGSASQFTHFHLRRS